MTLILEVKHRHRRPRPLPIAIVIATAIAQGPIATAIDHLIVASDRRRCRCTCPIHHEQQ
jgi:hypothetical protein